MDEPRIKRLLWPPNTFSLGNAPSECLQSLPAVIVRSVMQGQRSALYLLFRRKYGILLDTRGS